MKELKKLKLPVEYFNNSNDEKQVFTCRYEFESDYKRSLLTSATNIPDFFDIAMGVECEDNQLEALEMLKIGFLEQRENLLKKQIERFNQLFDETGTGSI